MHGAGSPAYGAYSSPQGERKWFPLPLGEGQGEGDWATFPLTPKVCTEWFIPRGEENCHVIVSKVGLRFAREEFLSSERGYTPLHPDGRSSDRKRVGVAPPP